MTADHLQNILADRFDRERWLDVVREVLPNAATYLTPQAITPDATRAKAIWQLGEVSLADEKNLAILEVEATPDVDLARNRAGLRALAARFIDQARYHGVLAIFRTEGRNDWRLTLAARESSFDETSSDIATRETAPRRYTYLLGPGETCRTPAERLLALRRHGSVATLANVIEAFSVEQLNKEFFRDFTEVFNLIAEELEDRFAEWKEDDSTRDLARQEAQILLNRLLFLYFVQRKGWLHRDTRYLVRHFRDHHESHGESASFYEKFLFPVFRILATEWSEREKAISHLPEHDPNRHDLPFLNGGLFHDDDLNDDASRRRKQLGIRNGTFIRVFDELLEHYNFTIREDSPLDQEVAIDPEMLGKIFEELILRDESGETGGKSKRHDTGSHYTPRPIVHYLCREALAAWLENHSPFVTSASPSERIALLLSLDAADGLDDDALQKLRTVLTPDEAGQLLRSLDDLRACDPAVGSGAFPIGLLHELLKLAHLAETRARGHDPVSGDLTWAYDAKKHFIQHALYGVDIQERATEICKLRLWLSLMVDHDLGVHPADCDRRSFQNALRRLEPLPNLDFKIRRANSLFDTIHGHVVDLQSLRNQTPDVNRWLNQLASAKLAFFTALKQEQKRRLRSEIYEALAELGRIELLRVKGEETGIGIVTNDEEFRRLQEIIAAERELGHALKLAKAARSRSESAETRERMLEKLESFFGDTTHPTFVWQLDFAEVFHRDGYGDTGDNFQRTRIDTEHNRFDIVIGNPPYVRQEKLKAFKPILQARYPDIFAGTADLYVYFYGLALQLLSLNGILAFISSNKWYRVDYGRKLRCYLAARTSLLHAIDFGDAPIFTSVAYPTIVIARNTLPPPAHKLHALNFDPRTPKNKLADFAEFYAANGIAIAQASLSPDGWNFLPREALDLLTRIRASGTRLRDYVGTRVYRGITTGYNEAFTVDSSTRNAIIAENESATTILKPFVRGRDIRRWVIEPDPQWLIFTRRGIDINAYPSVVEHLSRFRNRLTPGTPGGRKPGGYKWYEIQDNIAYWKEFDRPKIISTKVSNRPTFAFDTTGRYLGNTAYFFPVETNAHYLLGILNSKLLYAYAKRVFVQKQNDWYEVQPAGLEAFPIPDAELYEREAVEWLVEQLIALYHQRTVRESMASAPRDPLIAQYFEQWLDAMVYQLFFREELEMARLDFFKLFAEAKLEPFKSNTLRTWMQALRRHFENLYAPSHALRGALFALQSIDLIRAIEDEK